MVSHVRRLVQTVNGWKFVNGLWSVHGEWSGQMVFFLITITKLDIICYWPLTFEWVM